MKIKYFLFYLLFAFATSYSQSTLDLSKQLNEKNTDLLKTNIKDVLGFSSIGTPEERSLVNKLKLFLENPFDKNISEFNLNASIKALQSMVNQKPLMNEKGPWKGNSTFVEDHTFMKDLSGNVKSASNLTSDIVPGQAMSTKIIDATAKFLVDRTKQELTITFFENFRDKLNEGIPINFPAENGIYNAEKKGDTIQLYLRDFFPKTFLLLNNKNYFDIPSFGEVWLVAFKKDINEMPHNINNIIKSHDLFYNTQGGHFAVFAVDIIEQLKEGIHPLQVIEEINEPITNYNDFYSDKVVGILALFSRNLMKEQEINGVKKSVLITNEDLKALDASSIKYFTGLIYQDGLQKKILKQFMIDGVPLEDQINLANYTKFYYGIKSARSNYEKFDTLLKEITEQNQDSVGYYQKYGKYIRSFYSLLDESMESIYMATDKTSLYYQSYYYKTINPLANTIVGLNDAVMEKNYAECLLLTTELLNNLIEKDNKLVKDFGYYGNFVTDIVYASKNDTDVKKIIENYAMPVASYRIKRLHRSSWDVNAFPGIYLGYEFSESNSLNYGITAPIGISYSRKNKYSEDFNTHSSSSSLFLSVIDIGAPFSYRFTHDEAEGLPEDIKWEQVFSPGLFYILGINNTPLSVSAGVQFTPLLRKIDTNNILDTKNVVRASLAILVDIPLFNLYKAAEKKKL